MKRNMNVLEYEKLCSQRERRDRFACAALVGISSDTPEELAILACRYADALIAELDKEKTEP